MSMPSPPPDTRTAGQSGHIADHNTISDAITALESNVGALQLSQFNPPLSPTPVKTAAYTASAFDFVVCDVSGGGFTVKLPQAAADKTRVGIKIVNTSTSVVNLLTIQCQGSDVLNSPGGGTSGTLQLLNQGATFQYDAAIATWYVTGDDLPFGSLKALMPSVQSKTSAAGYTLVNGTGTIIAWTAPGDSAVHFAQFYAALAVTSGETGGAISLVYTDPAGNAITKTAFAASQTAGQYTPVTASCPQMVAVQAGSTVSVTQSSALTAGAAKLWASIVGV